jgi:hypothetical protein
MTIEQAAREYIRLRRLVIDLQSHRNNLHWKCDSEWGCDGNGHGCCFFQEDKSDWCPLCLEADVAHEWYTMALRHRAVALRRLEREVNR